MTPLERILFLIISIMTLVIVFLSFLVGESLPGVAATCLTITLIPIFFGCSVIDRL